MGMHVLRCFWKGIANAGQGKAQRTTHVDGSDPRRNLQEYTKP